MDLTRILYAEINIFSIAILLIIALNLSMFNKRNNRNYFSKSVWFFMISCFFDLLGKFCVGGIWSIPKPLILFGTALYYICFGISAYYIFLFSETVVRSTIFQSKKRMFFSSIPLIMFILLILSSMFNGCVFYINSNYEYTRGNLFHLQQLLSYSYIILTSGNCLLKIVMRKDHIYKDEMIGFIGFSVLPLLSLFVQIFTRGLPILSIGVVLSYLFIYIYSLQMQISIDFTTGVNSRRGLMSYLKSKVLSIKHNEKLYFMFVDIDSFKMINDEYGHIEGDRVLNVVASALQKVCQSRDGFCGRYGGDEFAIVYVLNNSEEIISIQEEICACVDAECKACNLAYPVSISIGYSEYGNGISTIQDLISNADSNMYDQKANKKVKHGTIS